MRRFQKKIKKNSGFTLAELLIVVAIIAVLVAISIPIFSTQLEKSRESTDLANVRAAYAEIMTAALTEDKGIDFYDASSNKWSITVNLKQKKDGWEIKTPITIGEVNSGADGGTNNEHTWLNLAKGNGTCEVVYQESTGPVFIWDGSVGGGSEQPSGGNGNPDDENITPPVEKNPDGENQNPESEDPSKEVENMLYNATLYPYEGTPSEGKTFNFVQGKFYIVNGKTYAYIDTDAIANQYYSPVSNHGQAFVEVSSKSTVYTKSDYNKNKPVQLGDFFKDTDGSYYIRRYDGNNQTQWKLPSEDSSAWLKIK